MEKVGVTTQLFPIAQLAREADCEASRLSVKTIVLPLNVTGEERLASGKLLAP
jgi:hypothetical protein